MIEDEEMQKSRICRKLLSHSHFQATIEQNWTQQAVDVLKSVPYKYDPYTRKWKFNLDDYKTLNQNLTSQNFSLSGPPLKYVDAMQKTIKLQLKADLKIENLLQNEPFLRESLYRFQKEGVVKANVLGGKILIADDMGLGKTIQSIAIAACYQKEWPLVVICPSSLKYNWKTEILKWLKSIKEEDIQVLDTGIDELLGAKINILSYNLFGNHSAYFAANKFKVFIVDESHSLKDEKSKRTKAIIPVLKNASRVIMLSGTPALSRPIELYSQLKTLKPEIFNNQYDFGKRYCNGQKGKYGNFDVSGSSNEEELKILLNNTVMLRRLKANILDELPPKDRQCIVISSNASEFNQLCYENNLSLTKRPGERLRSLILSIFKLTAQFKIPSIIKYLSKIDPSKKCIVFFHHTIVLDAVLTYFKSQNIQHVYIDGSITAKKRHEICEQFQFNKEIQFALLSLTACSFGLNLTAADTVIFAELFWNPGSLLQAEDRAHRIGQKNPVTVQYLLAKGTTDDFIWPLLVKKLDFLSKTGLSNEEFSEFEESLLENKTIQASIERFAKH